MLAAPNPDFHQGFSAAESREEARGSLRPIASKPAEIRIRASELGGPFSVTNHLWEELLTAM
jgi:hypothetical protein